MCQFARQEKGRLICPKDLWTEGETGVNGKPITWCHNVAQQAECGNRINQVASEQEFSLHRTEIGRGTLEMREDRTFGKPTGGRTV